MDIYGLCLCSNGDEKEEIGKNPNQESFKLFLIFGYFSSFDSLAFHPMDGEFEFGYGGMVNEEERSAWLN